MYLKNEYRNRNTDHTIETKHKQKRSRSGGGGNTFQQYRQDTTWTHLVKNVKPHLIVFSNV